MYHTNLSSDAARIKKGLRLYFISLNLHQVLPLVEFVIVLYVAMDAHPQIEETHLDQRGNRPTLASPAIND